jgi:hypothetical protein
LSAVLGNVGTVMSFRLGAEDAHLLAPVFAPLIDAEDLIECPNYQGYVRLHQSSTVCPPFSFTALPWTGPASSAQASKLVALSRRRWGVPAAECDARERERRDFIRSLEKK